MTIIIKELDAHDGYNLAEKFGGYYKPASNEKTDVLLTVDGYKETTLYMDTKTTYILELKKFAPVGGIHVTQCVKRESARPFKIAIVK